MRRRIVPFCDLILFDAETPSLLLPDGLPSFIMGLVGGCAMESKKPRIYFYRQDSQIEVTSEFDLKKHPSIFYRSEEEGLEKITQAVREFYRT